jgi:hypothetical protein
MAEVAPKVKRKKRLHRPVISSMDALGARLKRCGRPEPFVKSPGRPSAQRVGVTS